jgi:hypothetical protein
MAKIDWNHLKKKYGTENVRAGKYRALMREIIAHNTGQISDAMYRLSNAKMKRDIESTKTTGKPIVVPDLSTILPKRKVYIRKGAERGDLLTDGIRQALSRDLRGVMEIVTEKTGEPRYIRRTGAKAGTINPKIIDEYERRITETFRGYVERDKLKGMPPNIHTIAVTEVRSTVNDIKIKYAQSVADKNKNVEVMKVWVHNRGLSKTPRLGHMEVASKTMSSPIPIRHYFDVPMYYDSGRNKGKLRARHRMIGPHDPSAPPEQVIGCNCDIQFVFAKKKD